MMHIKTKEPMAENAMDLQNALAQFQSKADTKLIRKSNRHIQG